MKRNCLILLIVSLLVLCGCAQLPGGVPSPESGTGDVKILTHSGYHITGGFTGDYLDIFGELQNTSNKNLKFIKLTTTLYDSAGKVIETKWTYAHTDILLPGEKAPFVFMKITSEEDYKSYTVEVTSCRETTEEPYRDFEFLNTSSYIDDQGYYCVKGEIKNTGTQDIDFVGVIITCYNAEGEVISASGTCLIAHLKAGETASFDAHALPKQISSKIATYSLQTDVSD